MHHFQHLTLDVGPRQSNSCRLFIISIHHIYIESGFTNLILLQRGEHCHLVLLQM